MTDDDIQKLLDENRLVAVQEMFEAELFAFARAIAAKEREECAKMVENYCGAWDDKGQALVQMIRSRGE